MSAQRHLFTVLTPTYNRAHTLARVYESLCAQIFQDFEWVVVDDGSTDNTRELVERWCETAFFPIKYIWQPNQHKKTAFNRGVREARGELVVALDSDDALDPNALDAMATAWRDVPAEERHNYIAITGLCARPDGGIVGDMFPRDVMDTTVLDMSFRHHVKGEKFGCMRTEVLRQFPFPEDVAGFVPESIIWRAIGRAGYLTRFVNEVFRVYHDSPDSLSLQGRNSQQHALGMWLLAYDTVDECLPWFRHSPSEFFMAAARYTRFWLHMKHAGLSKPPGRTLHRAGAYALVVLMWPFGAMLYLRDRTRAR